MFAKQLELEDDLVEKLQRVVLFIALIYAPAWLSASAAADAPVNDLILLQRLLRYRDVDCQIADAALAAIRRHLWYLRPHTVVFALFSDKVEDSVKQEMAERLSSLPVPEVFVQDNVSVDEKTSLADLVDESSWLIFSRLHLSDPIRLSLPVAVWGEDPSYREAKKVIQALSVTNDVAERGGEVNPGLRQLSDDKGAPATAAASSRGKEQERAL